MHVARHNDESYPTFAAPPCRVIDLGICDYDTAYARQKALVDSKRRDPGEVDYLILVEHPEVYTYGRRSPQVPDASVGTNFRFVERGGEVTYHNPGQLVAYPILRLSESERDIHLHLRRLEETIIGVLADFGLTGERKEKATGVWVAERSRKIASIGVAATSWVTYHGSALNVRNDLSGFARVNPCGFQSSVMTSMEKEGAAGFQLEDVKTSFKKHFSEKFVRVITESN